MKHLAKLELNDLCTVHECNCTWRLDHICTCVTVKLGIFLHGWSTMLAKQLVMLKWLKKRRPTSSSSVSLSRYSVLCSRSLVTEFSLQSRDSNIFRTAIHHLWNVSEQCLDSIQFYYYISACSVNWLALKFQQIFKNTWLNCYYKYNEIWDNIERQYWIPNPMQFLVNQWKKF